MIPGPVIFQTGAKFVIPTRMVITLRCCARRPANGFPAIFICFTRWRR